MACPNCDHTMQNLGVNGQKVWWCPRCGTVKSEDRHGFVTISHPKYTAPEDGIPLCIRDLWAAILFCDNNPDGWVAALAYMQSCNKSRLAEAREMIARIDG